MGLNRPVLLAATLILFQIIVTVIGPLDTTSPPETLLAGALLYVLLGILAIGTILAPAQIAAFVSKEAISGSALIGFGLYIVGLGTAAFTSSNYIIAGAFYIVGGLLIVIGLVYPTGVLQKALAEASK